MNGTAQLKWIDTHAKLEECVARVAAIREAVGRPAGHRDRFSRARA